MSAITNPGSGSGGPASFATLTGGTNTGQSLVVGAGSSISTTGGGTIAATSVTLPGTTGQILFNNGGALGVSATTLGLNYNSGTLTLTLNGSGSNQLNIGQTGSASQSLLIGSNTTAATFNNINGLLSLTGVPLSVLGLLEPEGAGIAGVASSDILYGDSTTHTFTHNSNNNGVSSFSGAWQNTNVTPVTVAANVATDQNLMSASVPAGTLNRLGRSLRVWCAGVFTTPAAETTTITFKVKFGALTLLSIAVPSQSFTATNNQFNISGVLSIQTAGATGVFETHGNLVVDLGIGNLVPDSIFADTNTAVSSTVDLTAAQTLQVTVAYGTASTSNSTTQRQMVLETIG